MRPEMLGGLPRRLGLNLVYLLLGVTLVLILVLARVWRAVAELLLSYPDEQPRQDLRKEAFPNMPALPERASPPKVGDALSRLT